MWMLNIDTISFSNNDGNTYAIKDIKIIPTYGNTKNIQISENMLLDEICVDKNVYGEGKEDFSYKIFESNVMALAESGYNLNKIKTLRIPIE
jgi:hypothetical protein